jgi:hypothetical protein
MDVVVSNKAQNSRFNNPFLVVWNLCNSMQQYIISVANYKLSTCRNHQQEATEF